ncbi:MAG: tetratricopeptide repeat protein [Pseudomonadales bacterium]|nr:tetratricopeptide repeat protein [Pseudomonadales bacterium]
MVDDRTEDEQVEDLKNWFKENGTSLVVSIVIVLAVVFGYRSWNTQTRESSEAASAIYENLQQAVTVGPLESLSDEKRSTGNFLAEQLKSEYSSTTYAHFASLQMAKIAAEEGDLETAASELQWVLDNGVDDKLAIIANLRLAKVKLGLTQYDAALAQLDALKPGAHESSYEEVRGDIYRAMDRLNEAREAYQRAVNLQGDTPKPFTQMKRDDLVTPTAAIAMDKADDTEEEQDQ